MQLSHTHSHTHACWLCSYASITAHELNWTEFRTRLFRRDCSHCSSQQQFVCSVLGRSTAFLPHWNVPLKSLCSELHLANVSSVIQVLQTSLYNKNQVTQTIFHLSNLWIFHCIGSDTRSSAIAEGPCDASCQLKSCQLPRNSAETTYTTSPDQIDGMKLEI